MIEFVQALEKLLEKGIVVEPIWVDDLARPAYRIRLSDDETDTEKDKTATVRGW